jgi:DNA processing protein
MTFDKYWVALQLQNEKIGRKKVLQKLYNRRFFSSKEDIVKYKEELKKLNIEVVSSNEGSYPKPLKEISDYPLILFTKGNKNLLSKKMITIVGTRKMSSYGKWAVRHILRPLRKLKDIAIVSGLAKGIDGEVHKACLDFDIPTIAVVAGGIDKGYPKSNQDIYDEIVKKGLIISEFPPGRKIVKGMFPMRNRILAGISSATVIIESDIRGGSLITMNLALEYGREIFAVPNGINEESLQGCNMCILQGAIPLFSSTQLLNFCKNELYP